MRGAAAGGEKAMKAILATACAGALVVSASASAAPIALRPLIPHCSAEVAAGPWGRMCQPSWARLEADNGEVYHIDLRDLLPLPNGTVGAYVLVGDGTPPADFRQF